MTIFLFTHIIMNFRFSLTDIFSLSFRLIYLFYLCFRRSLCFYYVLVCLLWMFLFFRIYDNRLNWDIFIFFILLLEIRVFVMLLNSMQFHCFDLLWPLDCWRFWLSFTLLLLYLIWSLLLVNFFGQSIWLLLHILLSLPIHIVYWNLICHHSVLHGFVLKR